jgi:hypothetical protein
VDVLCNGAATGSIDLTVSGGTAPYTYTWSNGATTEDISGLVAGTYSVTVNDANGTTLGCTSSTSITITQPTAVAVSTTSTNVSCFGLLDGTIDLTVTGGTAPYNYVWSNGATTQDLTGLAAGTYTVTVTDNNGTVLGCTATTSVTISQPILVTVSATSTNVSCFGLANGTITATASAGATITVNGQPYNANATYAPGTYTIVATAANGNNNGVCTAITEVTITQPALVTVSATSTNVSCHGAADGTITVTASAGAVVTVNGQPYNASAVYGPGTYTILATAPNGNNNGGCAAVAFATITQPALVSLNISSTNVTCNGAANGTITATATGGASITVNGQPYSASAQYAPGTYTVVATAINGNNNGNCTATQTVTITQPATLVASSSAPPSFVMVVPLP